MGQVDAVQQHRQLRGVELGSERAIADARLAEAPLLEPLVREDEAAVVPGQHLRAVALLREEDEEVPRVEVLLPLVSDDGAQAVDAVPHVDGVGSEQDADGAREEQHGLSERREQLGQVADVGADEEAQHRPAAEPDLDETCVPRPR